MKQILKIATFLKSLMRVKRITPIIMWLGVVHAMIYISIIIPGIIEFMDLYEQVEKGTYAIMPSFAASTQEECDRILESEHLTVLCTESKEYAWQVEQIQRLSEEPWCDKLADEYQIVFCTTDMNIERTMSWHIDNTDMTGTLSITPGNIIHLPDGNYTWYPYDLSSFSESIDGFEQYYIGRAENLHFPNEGITHTWRTRLVGSVYYKLTALGLTVNQTTSLLIGHAVILYVICIVIGFYVIIKSAIELRRLINSTYTKSTKNI